MGQRECSDKSADIVIHQVGAIQSCIASVFLRGPCLPLFTCHFFLHFLNSIAQPKTDQLCLKLCNFRSKLSDVFLFRSCKDICHNFASLDGALTPAGIITKTRVSQTESWEPLHAKPHRLYSCYTALGWLL